MSAEIDITVTLRTAPTLGGGATIGDLRGMCEGRAAEDVAGLVDAWVHDCVIAGETNAERLSSAVAQILAPHGLELALRIVP